MVKRSASEVIQSIPKKIRPKEDGDDSSGLSVSRLSKSRSMEFGSPSILEPRVSNVDPSSTSNGPSSVPSTTWDRIRSATAEGVRRRIAVYGADVGNGGGSRCLCHTSLSPDDLVPVEHYFVGTLDTYVGSGGMDDPENSRALWLRAVEWLQQSVGTTRYLPAEMLSKLLVRGILEQQDRIVRGKVQFFLKSYVNCLHPPIHEAICKIYLKTLCEDGICQAYQIASNDPWDFVNHLLEEFCGVGTENVALTLDVVCSIMEINFNHWFNEFSSSCDDKKPMIARLLWPYNDEPILNQRLRALSRYMARSVTSEDVSTFKQVSLFTGVAAQYICTYEKTRDLNVHKQNLAGCIAEEIMSAEDGEVSVKTYHVLSMLKPDWLSLAVTLQLLLNGDGGLMCAISLRNLVSRVTEQKNEVGSPGEVNANVVDSVKQKTGKMPSSQGRNENFPLDPTKKNQYGETPLHLACKNGNLDRVRLLLNHPSGVDVNAQDHNGWTPLHEACFNNQIACVEKLLSLEKLDLSVQGGEERVTALQEAVCCNHVDLVRLFLARCPERKRNRFLQERDLLPYARSNEMTLALQSGFKAKQIARSEAGRVGFSVALRKCISCLSLHFIQEKMKVELNKRKGGRLNEGPAVRCHNNVFKLDFVRNEVCAAEDFRTYNQVRNLAVREDVKSFLKVLR